MAPAQPIPLTLHATDALDVPVTVALNCRVNPAITLAFVGETVIATPGRIVTLAEADFVLSAFDVAVTVTLEGLGSVAGAE